MLFSDRGYIFSTVTFQNFIVGGVGGGGEKGQPLQKLGTTLQSYFILKVLIKKENKCLEAP